MLKLEILIALFATMLKVQADAGIEYTHHVPECHRRIEAERAIVGPSEINGEHADVDYEHFKKLHNPRHECGKINHHHQHQAAALSDEEMPIRHHAHNVLAEQGHEHHEGVEEAHRLAHHVRKHDGDFDHKLHEEKPLYVQKHALKDAHKYAHEKAHKHAHCGIVEGHKMNERGHFRDDVEHVHPVHRHAHHDHKTFYAHKLNADKNHRDGHPIEHIKESCPLSAHLNAGSRHNKHKKFVQTMPGKGRVDHDSNDFTSFEVAQLDILRVTKLDSEHAHDRHSHTPSKDVKKAILHRAAEFKKDKAHGQKPSHKENKDKLRKLKLQSNKSLQEKSADSDDDVREHIKALKKTHRALKDSHKKENESDENDDKKAKLRALIQARVRKHREEKETESEKPKASTEDAEKKPAKGFKNAFKKTFSFGKKNNKDSADDTKGDENNGKDLHLKAKDRVRLVADLKAISELDREALQYLDTSCGPVKSLIKKKKLSRRAKKQQKKEEKEKKKQTASN